MLEGPSWRREKVLNHTTIPLQTISKELKTHLEGDSLDIRSRMYGLGGGREVLVKT